MNSRAKVCSVVVDEMAIKEGVTYDKGRDMIEGLEEFGSQGSSLKPANHAVVFMARGLESKWKQPLGYFLSRGPMSGQKTGALLLECITLLMEVGLTVKVIVADQGTNNQSMFTNVLNTSTSDPCFTVNGEKIYAMYDPPHLLKSLRNNLKRTGFIHSGAMVADWAHIQEFYKKDSRLPIRLAHKLSTKHIFLSSFSAMRVRLAAQVLSHTVAAGITSMVSFKAMPQEAKGTAEFVQRADKLFNCFNSKAKLESGPMKGALSAESKHSTFLKDCQAWLKTVSLRNGRQVPSLEGWKRSVNALLLLWDDLHANYEFKYLLTNRLNQDCLENFFSIVRWKGGHAVNPDAGQFRLSFRAAVVDTMAKPCPGANCEKDGDHFLLSFLGGELSGFETTPAIPRMSQIASVPEVAFQTAVETTAELSSQSDNVRAYIAGYLCHRAEKEACSLCRGRIVGPNRERDPRYIFLKEKQFELTEPGKGLIFPSLLFFKVVGKYETRFRELFKYCDPRREILGTITNGLSDLPCHKALRCRKEDNKCNMALYVITLFAKLRVHHALKTANANLKQTQVRNRKLLTFRHL